MHILYLHQYFVPPDAPGGTRSYEFARRFVERGHRVTMVTSNAMMTNGFAASDRVTRRKLDGIELVILPVRYGNEMSYARRILAFAKFAARAAREVARHRPDVVFATSTPLTIAVPGLLARVMHRVPMVFEVRDLWPEVPIAMGALRSPAAQALARGLEWIAYHGSAEVVALSPGMADGVAAAGIPRERITTIPNSCDIANFAVSPSAVAAFRRERLPDLADGQPLIVYGGTYGKVNDAGWLVDVAAAMRSTAPQIAFAMAGTGAEEDAIRQRARASGVLGRSLWILPALPKRDVPAFLGCAAVATSLVSPVRELWNNSANKFFDALAAGKPIAINHEGWQADLLRQTGAGIVVPHGDPAAAAHRLAALAGSEEARQRASAAARRLARESFDRDKLAVQLEAVLARAVRLHRSPVAEVVGLA